MSFYFDTRNDAVAVIETDAPDAGFVKLSAKQSRLAARYRLEDGKVTDRHPGKTDEEVLAAIAAEQADQAAQAARLQIGAPQTAMTKLAFMNRFTMAELAAIYTAAKTEVMVEVFLDKLKLAEHVDVTDLNTIAGLQALVSGGLLLESRVRDLLQ